MGFQARKTRLRICFFEKVSDSSWLSLLRIAIRFIRQQKFCRYEVCRVLKELVSSCLSLRKAKWKLGRDSLARRSNRTIRIW